MGKSFAKRDHAGPMLHVSRRSSVSPELSAEKVGPAESGGRNERDWTLMVRPRAIEIPHFQWEHQAYPMENQHCSWEKSAYPKKISIFYGENQHVQWKINIFMGISRIEHLQNPERPKGNRPKLARNQELRNSNGVESPRREHQIITNIGI